MRYSAGHCTYPGDATDIIGKISGPTRFGTYLVATSAELRDGETRVGWHTLQDGDMEALVQDSMGFSYVPELIPLVLSPE